MAEVMTKEFISLEDEKKLKDEAEAKRYRNLVIPEETDFRVVRFQNNEEKGVPLEFSAGAPISKENRNYVLKDGKCYLLGEKVRKHIKSKGYPIYENVPDPEEPTQFRSMQTGFQHRFSLTEIEDDEIKKVTVYEHLREKLNHKVLPGAYENNAVIPGRADPLQGKQLEITEKENDSLRDTITTLTESNEKLANDFNTLMVDHRKFMDLHNDMVLHKSKLVASQSKKKG